MAEPHPSISDNQEETQVTNNHSKTQNNPNEQSDFSNPSQTNDHPSLCGQTQSQGIPNLARPTKCGGGRAPGSQGYSLADCTALVMAVKKILPLGRSGVFALHGSEKQHRWIRQSRIGPPTMFSSTMRGTRMATPMTKVQNGLGAPIPLSPNDENDPFQLNYSHHMDN
ncbi:hypothetical protein VP01_2914g1 [Puccinia sorghi]|uniref:Uncharacterized protein n=1 Tax=Puccinia sorghi TaxID=27349 RepID=A0A0L6V1D6_9BASI|nr:hypothetical protein VP01_2914g1 [Puccinia sorghi]